MGNSRLQYNQLNNVFSVGGRRGLLMQSMPITTNDMSPNPAHCEMYSIQLYVIKFVSDLRQVGGFLRVLRFRHIIKLTAKI